MENIEAYKQLAERNGWDFSIIDNKPYFMKNGQYAVPDESTTDIDKQLLARIISEGSKEMEKIILTCWDNNIAIGGPCSGIRSAHDNQPTVLHFTFISEEPWMNLLCSRLQLIFPNYNHLCRKETGKIRYDLTYLLKGRELTAEQSDSIFAAIGEQLNTLIDKYNKNKTR